MALRPSGQPTWSSGGSSPPATEPAAGGRPDLRPHPRGWNWMFAFRLLHGFYSPIVGWQGTTWCAPICTTQRWPLGSRQRAGQDVTGLADHSDRGSTIERFATPSGSAEAEAVASVGSKGDSDGNAMAEALTVQGRVHPQPGDAPRGCGVVGDVEIVVAEQNDLVQRRRGDGQDRAVPPAEDETTTGPASHPSTTRTCSGRPPRT